MDEQIDLFEIKRKISDKINLVYVRTKKVMLVMDPRDFTNVMYVDSNEDKTQTTILQKSVVSQFLPDIKGCVRVEQLVRV